MFGWEPATEPLPSPRLSPTSLYHRFNGRLVQLFPSEALLGMLLGGVVGEAKSARE